MSLAPPPKTGLEGHDERGNSLPEERGAGPFGLLFMALVAVFVVFGVVRPFVAEPFGITTDSMAPTLRAGDSVLATKFSYVFSGPDRGDLVLFEAPDDGAPTIKRVAGEPGDTVAIRDGVLFVNGEGRREAYVDYNLADSTFMGPTEVPEGHLYLMGDNRANSLDSRSYGPVPRGNVLGGVPLRLWPLDRVGPP